MLALCDRPGVFGDSDLNKKKANIGKHVRMELQALVSASLSTWKLGTWWSWASRYTSLHFISFIAEMYKIIRYHSTNLSCFVLRLRLYNVCMEEMWIRDSTQLGLTSLK